MTARDLGATMLFCKHTAKRVEPFRWHHRPAEYIHRVNDPENGKKWVTLVWHGPKRRDWGFWVEGTWVHWRKYLYGDQT